MSGKRSDPSELQRTSTVLDVLSVYGQKIAFWTNSTTVAARRTAQLHQRPIYRTTWILLFFDLITRRESRSASPYAPKSSPRIRRILKLCRFWKIDTQPFQSFSLSGPSSWRRLLVSVCNSTAYVRGRTRVSEHRYRSSPTTQLRGLPPNAELPTRVWIWLLLQRS